MAGDLRTSQESWDSGRDAGYEQGFAAGVAHGMQDRAAELAANQRLLVKAEATIARLEAERDELRKSLEAMLFTVSDEQAEQRESLRLMGASAARMREALEDQAKRCADCSCYEVHHTTNGKPDKCWLCMECSEFYPKREVRAALADPAPLEWLAAHDAEVVEPYRALVEKLHDDLGLECSAVYGCYLCDKDRTAGRAGTEGQP